MVAPQFRSCLAVAVVCGAVAVLGLVGLAIHAIPASAWARVSAHPEVAVGALLAFLFTVVVHAILLGSLAFGLVKLVTITFFAHDTTGRYEWLYRTAALGTGALLALGSQATGVSLPDLINQSLSSPSKPLAIGVVGIATPAAVGLAFAYYLRRQRGRQQAVRVMIFAGTLVTVVFADVYAAAVGAAGFGLSVNLLPNVSFLLAFGMHLWMGGDLGQRVGSVPGR